MFQKRDGSFMILPLKFKTYSVMEGWKINALFFFFFYKYMLWCNNELLMQRSKIAVKKDTNFRRSKEECV